MSTYHAPLQEMTFVLNELAGLAQVASLPGFEEASPDTVNAILEEAAKFATNVLDPLNSPGDREGATRLPDGSVKTPAGFKDAYQQYCANGWNGLTKNPEFGGQGLTQLVATPVEEMWHAANMAFDLCPLLTQGAIDAIELCGTPEQKERFLPKMVDGTWTGTMNLTEPQAGSDLAAVRTRAVPQGDGSYKLYGQKIFITYGEHDYTENIIHMVLARTPNAPEGVKGISLFIVPKYLVNADGSLGARNDVHCVSLEHKLGIHASPTAVLAYGDQRGAIGYLIGEENRGLEFMFIMMNLARFSVGVEGVGISERAYQRAVAYARDRVQGKPVGLDKAAGTIIEHPDIRRMLMTMRAYTEAMRAVAYVTAAALDNAHRHPDPDLRKRHQAFVDLMIPIVKGWSTETAQEVTYLGVQVHGGMGFIEETGAAQHYRDARITTIYEGTNGIQSIDLVTRKLAANGGASVWALLDELTGIVKQVEASNDPAFGTTSAKLRDALGSLERASRWLSERVTSAPNDALAGATPYLQLFGSALGGCWLAGEALAARTNGDAGDPQRYVTVARFFAENITVQAGSLEKRVTDSADAVNGADVVLLG